MRLSGQSQADYLLRGFVDGRDVRLELDRDELAGILAEPLDTLRRACVEPNTRIPVERRSTFATTTDDQTAVDVIIYNGQLESSSKIGQFRLDNIPPAPGGTPEIDVTFAIDASCVLEVTAKERSTGHSNSIKVSDTTLLSPREVEEMARRHREQQERQEVYRRPLALLDEADECDVEAPWHEFRNRLDGYRPTAAPLDAETQRLLADMYRGANQMEVDPLPD